MKHLTALQVIVCHDENVRRYGGLPGIVDAARIEALLARVRNHERYEGVTDVFELAALYCVAIARGHAFLDGNKRTALQLHLGVSQDERCEDLRSGESCGDGDPHRHG